MVWDWIVIQIFSLTPPVYINVLLSLSSISSIYLSSIERQCGSSTTVSVKKKKSEFEASIAEKDKHIESLEVELKLAREEFEAETSKIRQESSEAVVHLNLAQVKIKDLKD